MRPTLIKLRSQIPVAGICLPDIGGDCGGPAGDDIPGSPCKCIRTALTPENFSLKNYQKVLTSPATLDSIKNSLFLSVTAGIVCMFLGVMVAYVINRINQREKSVLEILSVLPYSNTRYGAGNRRHPFLVGSIFGIKLYNTIWIILVAYMARYLSFSMKSASASLQQVNSSLEEASRAAAPPTRNP